MNITKLSILLFLASTILFANIELKDTYYIENDYILLSDIVDISNTTDKKDVILFNINKSKHSKRIKSKDLINRLHKYGYKDIDTKHNYIQFSRKSPIDLTNIKEAIHSLYKDKYKNIKINKITVQPRKFTNKIPKTYDIGFSKKTYLRNKGNLFIKTLQHKKIFFNYTIDAEVKILEARKDIHKDEAISKINTKIKKTILTKFKAMPISEIDNFAYQAKHNIKKGKILTTRDVTGLYIIKKGSTVNISVLDNNLVVSFTAKARQNGRLGDTISVINRHGKKIKVVVTGKNSAEVR
jgi:flagella basal body P-ring formation protein FlgA